MELMIATRKTVRELQLEHDIATDRVYTGSFMTSLDMQGSIYVFSICLKYEKEQQSAWGLG